MSFHEQQVSSPMSSRGDVIDQLIYHALLGEIRGAEPSPQVWDNICQRITATDASCQAQDARSWISLLLDSALILFNVFFGENEWETQLVRRREPIFWPLPFSGSLVLVT
jgi:hypothetical protein